MGSSNVSSRESPLAYDEDPQSPDGTTPCDRLGVDLMNVLENDDEIKKEEVALVFHREIENTGSDASAGSSFTGANGVLGGLNANNETNVEANDIDEGLTLKQQREIIARLIEASSETQREGDKVCIIPKEWYDKFLDANVTDPRDIGPIDTHMICRDFENFVLEDYNTCPYLSVPESVFEFLVESYGLTSGSYPVVTNLVLNQTTGKLETEYNKWFFRLHFLTDKQELRKRRQSQDDSVLYLSLSALNLVRDLIEKSMNLFFERADHLDINSVDFKIWFVSQGSEFPTDSSVNNFLNASYEMTPLQFLELPIKKLLVPEMFENRLDKITSNPSDLVIEVKPIEGDYHWASNYFAYNKLGPASGTTGLVNLGNSCYMNSALQCLVHVPQLRDYFLYNGYEKEINEENPLGYHGYVAKAFSNLVQKLFQNKLSTMQRNGAFPPTMFKSTVGHFNSMFSGYMQQDSQEFLAFLLDSLHEDLNRIMKKEYIEKPSLSADDDVNDWNVIKKLASETWEMHLKRNCSIITDLFVGMYKSTLYCPECKNISITFDPYNDVTLPLPVNTVWSKTVKIFPMNSPPLLLEVELSKSSMYMDLKEYVGKISGLDPNTLFGCEVFSNQIYVNYESTESNAQFLTLQELIKPADDVVFYELPVTDNNDIIVPVVNTRIEKGYRNAMLFGVPFFITLTKEETHNPGAIRTKLQKKFVHLSGGFIPFPTPVGAGVNSVNSFPLLAEKYPDVELHEYKDILQYVSNMAANKEKSFFSIKILPVEKEQQFVSINQAGPNFWAPFSQLNYSKVIDINDRLSDVVKDLYNYPTLAESVEGTPMQVDGEGEVDLDKAENYSDSFESENKKLDKKLETNIGNRNKNDAQDEDMEIMDDIEEDASIEPEPEPTDNIQPEFLGETDDSLSSTLHGILSVDDMIVCEWEESASNEAFSDDKIHNWENPAALPNTELENAKLERTNVKERTITLDDCLQLFSKPEILGLNDSWYCPTCKEHRQATKQIQLWNTPDILLIHLKRFESQRSFSDKIDATVNFPITNLDLSKHTVYKDDLRGSIYDLYAVDNHYGGLGGGHYTAYVKNFVDNKWYYFDDSRVTETVPENSVAGSAYLLFYIRRSKDSNELGSTELQEIIKESRQGYDQRVKKIYDEQMKLYETNKTDNEEDIPDDTAECKEDVQAPEYSNRSLEVGHIETHDCGDEYNNDDGERTNSGRRKLRLLKKVYKRNSDLSSSSTSEISEGGLESESTDLGYKNYTALHSPE
ncbi:ubp12p [Saccharomyces arboricola H-6]|uniref:ubiquitinyl hydrolase 1 n=1 Tax=Saccharomyces arboricola (strain H-6 / AS 2.3317 / CBS 10644) TaxID=1160507 RepID=J8PM68_SACAR|nr:ubp12p [Saccharomyces arboricola H-6]